MAKINLPKFIYMSFFNGEYWEPAYGKGNINEVMLDSWYWIAYLKLPLNWTNSRGTKKWYKRIK